MSSRYFGQWEPPVDQVLEKRYFQGKSHGIALECGAFDGITENCTKFFEDNHQWTCYNIEPVPTIFAKLVQVRSTSRNFNLALSNVDGVQEFAHAVHPELGQLFGNGSISHAPEHYNHLARCHCTFEKLQVPSVTYATFVIRAGIQHLDLFVLDVEGHELQVIEGMRGAAVFPQVFVVEFPHLGLESIQSALHKFLPVSYRLDFVFENNAYFVLDTSAAIGRTSDRKTEKSL